MDIPPAYEVVPRKTIEAGDPKGFKDCFRLPAIHWATGCGMGPQKRLGFNP